MANRCLSVPCSKLEDIFGKRKSVSATEQSSFLAMKLEDNMDTGQNVSAYLVGVG